jgi:hypothetical protein
MGFRVLGLQKAINGCERLKNNLPEAQQEGLDVGIEAVMAQSQVEVPKDTNALAESAHIVNRSSSGTTRSKSVRYGEPGEGEGVLDYAAAVHEILKARHTAPTKAKYVEDPLVQEGIPVTKKATKVAAKKAVKRSFR